MSPSPAGAIVRLVASKTAETQKNKSSDPVRSGSAPDGARSAAQPSVADPDVDDARAKERAEERGLCERAQDGDKKALATLLRKYGPILFRSVLLPRLGSEAAAQDALADTYMRVVERFDQFEWRGCGVYPWLRVIAMRIALDVLRARKRETLFEPNDLCRAVETAEADLRDGIDVQLCEKRDREAASAKLEDALGRINQRYAKAIRLRVLQEQSREQAAEALGVTVPTFDVVLHRALTALKKAVRSSEGTS